jgi:hypothetical protein
VKRTQNATLAQSADAPINKTSATSVPPKPDYRSKSKTTPPPKSDRPLKIKEKRPRAKEKPARGKRPVDRPPKEKRDRPATKEKSPREKRVVVQPRRPQPMPMPPVVVDVEYVMPATEMYVDYYGTGDDEADLESYSVLLTATALVFNGVFIQAGERNEFAAVVGFIFGATSLAVGSSDNARVPVLDYFLGAASIALSVWNLTGGIQRIDPSVEDVDVYHAPATTSGSTSQTVVYSYSF